MCCLVFLLTVLFCRLVRSYTKLEVGPPKLHRFKNVLRININQIKCCCALIILLTRLVGCMCAGAICFNGIAYNTCGIWIAKNNEHNSFRGVLYRIVHCEKFRTLISNSWPILQTSVTFPAHASIEMYGIRFIFVCHKSEKAASKVIMD